MSSVRYSSDRINRICLLFFRKVVEKSITVFSEKDNSTKIQLIYEIKKQSRKTKSAFILRMKTDFIELETKNYLTSSIFSAKYEAKSRIVSAIFSSPVALWNVSAIATKF